MNITEDFRRLLDVERTARAEAERANRLKDEFLVLVSHELRTPLAAICLWSQLLRSKAAEKAQVSEGLGVIENNARAQLQIINDLLDAGRIVAGKIPLDLRQLSLASVVKSAVDTLRPAALEKLVRLEYSTSSDVPFVLGDSGRLGQVFRNLISNAVKFTPAGGSVRVMLREHQRAAQVTVEDTGIGIEPGSLPHIFDRFWQTNDAGMLSGGGLGIGLWIVKQIVEPHGGTVHAASDGAGAGSRFVVTLPLLSPRDSSVQLLPRVAERLTPACST